MECVMNLIITAITNKKFKQPVHHHTSHTLYQTVAGNLQITISDAGILEAGFITSQAASDKPHMSEIKTVVLIGTAFQLKVWQATLAIPTGETRSYQDIATSIGHPDAWRAVANALAQNKIAYFIPCHRVIRKNGGLGGYKWGIDKKKALLQAEKRTTK